jgi:hypothetical protein
VAAIQRARRHPDKEVPGGIGNVPYANALSKLDLDMSQYIHDNTEDEFTHFNFLNHYLQSKGADPVDLGPFRTLHGSTATGAADKKRITPAPRTKSVSPI